MDPIFEILENAGNPTTPQHRSKWSQVEPDLKRSGLCISCGHNPTVQRSLLGVRPKPGHPCYKQNLCIPCYDYEHDRSNPITKLKSVLMIAELDSPVSAIRRSPPSPGQRKRRNGRSHRPIKFVPQMTSF